MNWFFGYALVLVCFLFLTLPVLGQGQMKEQVMHYTEFYKVQKTIEDSLRVAEQNQQQGKAAKAEQTATYLLKTYPFIPAQISRVFSTDELIKEPLRGYPANVFSVRAKAREALGNYKAAETDISEAIKNFPQRYFIDPQRYFTESGLTWEYYELRARLRFKHLRNQKGGCADLGVLFKVDSVRASNLGYKGCSIPKLKFANSPKDFSLAHKAASDSLLMAEKALSQNQHTQALRILNNLIAGRVSRYEKYKVEVHNTNLKVKLPGQMYGMRAEAKQGLGDFKGALADLDTAVSQMNSRCITPGDGLWQYRRGLLRIDYLKDREGGCADLAKAYQCDTTITGPDHAKWRDCMLPAHKKMIGQQEHQESLKTLEQAATQIDDLLTQNQFDQALKLTTAMTRGQVGRFENVWKNYPKMELKGFVHYRRNKALQGLLRYPEALAELDTAIRYTQSNRDNGWMFCQRGTLKIDILKDPTGCDDLRSCYLNGYIPIDKNWRNCDFQERKTSYKLKSKYIWPVTADIDSWDLQLAIFKQGNTGGRNNTGAYIGMYNSPGEWLVNWGPSLGVDIMKGYNSSFPVIAPKVGFEGHLIFVSGRLDVGYYGYKGIHDLRLTPQAGVSFLAIMHAMYGYSIPLLKYEQPFLSRHRVSLNINFVELTKIGG